jgi:hypothetical protein
MPLYYVDKGLDAYFEELSQKENNEIIILNDYDYFSQVDREYITSISKQVINDDVISLESSCLCGEIKGNYNNGVVCENCNTKVRSRILDFDPILWIEATEEIGNFIHPEFLFSLRSIVDGSFSIIRWICDTTYNPPKIDKNISIKRILTSIKSLDGFERNYAFLRDNIPEIITAIIAGNSVAEKNRRLLKLKQRYLENVDTIHSKRLAIINRRFIVEEKSNKGIFVNKTLMPVSDVILSLFQAINSDNPKKISIIVGRALNTLSHLYENINKEYFGGKKGLFRKLIGGMRSSMTFRNVIVPMLREHQHDECIIPWGSSVILFEYHLINRMIKDKKLSPVEMKRRLKSAVNNKDDYIEKKLEELFALSGGKILFNHHRNPSQGPYGNIALKAIDFDRNPANRALRVSPLVVGDGNGDYDGDYFNSKLAVDNYEKTAYQRFIPGNHSLGWSPGKLFSKVTLTDPVSLTISNAIAQEHKEFGIKR